MDGNLLKGLSRKNPKASDKSTSLPGNNINSDSTRTKTATTPPTLGPRTA